MLCEERRIFGTKKVDRLGVIPDSSPKQLDVKAKEYSTHIQSINSCITPFAPCYTEVGADIEAIKAFEQIYMRSPVDTAFTPYRICPIGAHSDHNLGKITGFAG